MGEQNGTKWKDEGLDCLVLDEFLIPNPKNIENVPSNNGDVNVPKTGEHKIDGSDTSQANTVRYYKLQGIIGRAKILWEYLIL